MATPNNKKFAWLITNFSFLPSDKLYSAPVLISDFNWRLHTYPKGYKGGDSLILSLAVADGQSLPSEWRRYVKFSLTVVNQISDELSIHKETKLWFDQKSPGWGLTEVLPLAKLHDKDGGFLVNDELKIVAEIEALEVESVRRIFEKQPDIAVDLRAKNKNLRTACMNFLFSLIETLHQSHEELSNEDLMEAYNALAYLKNAVVSLRVTFTITSMEKQVENSFVWVIKNPTSLSSTTCNSDPFLIAGCKWQLAALSKGNSLEFFYQYRGVTDHQSLPSKWRRHVKLRLNIVNRQSEKLSIVTDSEFYLNETSLMRRYPTVLPPSKILAKDGGFLVNGQLMIVVEVVAHEVVGTLGELQDSVLLSRIEENHGAKSNDLLNKTRQVNESVGVNGFQVLPSQVESVRRIFEKYPDLASQFRCKNQHLKSTYMNVLLGLIETLCQSPQGLSDEDLDEASSAVSYVTKGGFKVDWLEKKLEEVKEKKKKLDTGKARLQQMEKEFQKLNRRCLLLKTLMEKENADMSAAIVALSFDDVLRS
ncbi:unnamed protein product [Thlaspi arvense]|uniref:MATH domain-containing protein n=1 Tax=Thlaspi arvense TaxID=13288 RepID=A0AAU9SHT6_THLAR|nr:unnamed protein product [Thlaspi arvense]